MCNVTVPPQESLDYLDIAFKSATICIALFNIYFASKIFRIKNKKEDSEKERDRKIQLLKTLVLDHNLKHYYSVFDEIEAKLTELKTPNLNDENKSAIDTSIADLFIKLRRKFYDSLLAIDNALYNTIIGYSDELQTNLTNAIFDPGVNLSHAPKYDELIQEKVINTKTEIIKKLFN